MTAQETPVFRWTREEFVDAWNAGAFGDHRRVQLIEGEVWDLGPMQSWHGKAVFQVGHLLRAEGVVVTAQTLPMPASMPDPDAWVLRSGAFPIRTLRGYSVWSPADVLLVVEVSDATLRADLTQKARMYAGGGVEHYWVVARDALHVHTEPGPDGYASVEVLGPDEMISLPYAPDRTFAVGELLG